MPDVQQENGSVCEENSGATKRGKKIRRIIKISLLSLAVLLAAVVVTVVLLRDTLVEKAVVQLGSHIIGTPVEIAGFSSSFSGTVELRGLKVSNPPGYHKKYAFVLDRVYLSLKPETLFENRIEIEAIKVSGLHIVYEPQLNGSNLQDIQRNIEDNTAAGGDNAPDDPDSREADPDGSREKQEAEKQVVIRELTINDYSVTLANAMTSSSVVLPLPPVAMNDVGEGQSLRETVNMLYTEMLSSVFKALRSAGVMVSAALDDALKAAGSGARNAGSGANAAVQSLSDAVGGLFSELEKSVKQPAKRTKNR